MVSRFVEGTTLEPGLTRRNEQITYLLYSYDPDRT